MMYDRVWVNHGILRFIVWDRPGPYVSRVSVSPLLSLLPSHHNHHAMHSNTKSYNIL